MKKIFSLFLIFNSSVLISRCCAQSILDSCFTSASPSVTFTSSATLSDAYDADLLDWTGTAWNGAWSNANITTPPPCNVLPVRAIWVGDSGVWTTGGEAFGLRFSPPLVAGNTYHFFFTYVSAGFGSSGAFAPNVFTNNSGFNGGNYVGDFIPAGNTWETHPFSFTATAVQAGDDYLIIRSTNGSGMVLNLCAETFTDLVDDSLTICIGDSAILQSGSGFQSYSWNTGETTSQITVHNSGTYIATNTGFCGTSSDTIVVTVDACGMFPIAVFSTPDNHICPGTCTDFINLSQNATSYEWSFAGASPTTSTDVNPTSVCYNTPGTYAVQLVATNVITSDTLVLSNFITVYPYPPPQGIMQSGDTLFANQGAVSYQWYHDGNIIPGATDYFYIAPEGGDYNVVATDVNGCEAEAAIFDVVASVKLTPGNEQLVIIPNPVKDELVISSSELRGKASEIKIYNMLGKIVQTTSNYFEQYKATFDVRSFAKGLYWLEITSEEKIFRTKFLKQ